MAEDFTNINEGAYIIAESIIESAKIYAETLRHAADEIEQLFLQTKKESIEAIRELQAIKKQFEEQKKKYEDELAALNAIIKQKTEDLVGPYILHDFFLLLRPLRLLRLSSTRPW